jgi:hypothetical protein
MIEPVSLSLFLSLTGGGMIHSLITKHPVGSNSAFRKACHTKGVAGRLLAFVAIFALLLLGHGFGAEWPVPPQGQPVQIKSQVTYDPKLADPFFESEKWSNGNLVAENAHGRILYTREECSSDQKGPRCLKNTARFISSQNFEHTIDFCHAKLLHGDTIELFIHDDDSPIPDYLRIVVQKGVFSSQYWTYYKAGRGLERWTSTRQKLTLDKRVYRNGDVIKGRIDFECLEEPTNPKYVEKWGRNPKTIKVYGVFKTTVE